MLKEFIDKFYLDKNRERVQSHFYITDAGKCPRATFFKFKKAPRKELEARVLRMFDHGDLYHYFIMRALFGAREVRVVAGELDIPPQEMISGRADAILSINNELYVLDIKSMNSMIFDKLQSPKEENINQLQLYLHFFQVPKGILLYINKNSQDIKEFIVDYDRNLCSELLSQFGELKKKIDSDIVPSLLTDYPENWQCRYCQFREICDLVGKKEISWEKFKKQMERSSQGENSSY